MSLKPLHLIPWLRPKKDPRPPALAPGTLVHVGERRVDHVTFRVIDYSTATIREVDSRHVAECVEFEGRDSPTWIMVIGLHETDKIGELLRAYDIHPLIQDDIVNTQHQPKAEDFGDYIYVAARQIIQTGDEARFDVQQFSMILTNRVLISFHEAPSNIFDPVIARLRDGKGRLRAAGADYLAWALLDALLDNYISALDQLGDEVAEVDAQLTDPCNNVAMGTIHSLRAQTNYLFRAIRPMREVAISLQRSESPLLSSALQPFLRDLYDHAWHAIETADHLREAVTAIREFYQATLAQRMNEVMKVLTLISTVFLPLTFLAGVYGMNFDFMPELHSPWGYPVVWAAFLFITLGMLWFFRRKKWL